jgi:GABA(A) receptor-associated protein
MSTSEYPNVKREDPLRILEKYPDRVPIIVKTVFKLPPLDKHKYLVPRDLTVGQFIHVLKRRIELGSEKALFIFVDGGILPPTSSIISEIYDKHKDENLFLYMEIALENTFG